MARPDATEQKREVEAEGGRWRKAEALVGENIGKKTNVEGAGRWKQHDPMLRK